jgi:uncharacterized membrane protein YphA (DoxX/SURF4 family)
MKRFQTISGITGLVLLLTGLFFIYLGYTSKTVVDEFNIYWMFTYSSLALGLLIVVHDSGIRWATLLSRIVVGSLFVVSGLIKANDPKGFGYKLEEYFMDNSLGGFWTIFHDYALPLAIFISTIEVLLGLAVLVGGKSRLVNVTLLGMTLFFAWLTWFTATCGQERDVFALEKQAKYDEAKKACGEWYDYKDTPIDSTLLPEEVKGITDCNKRFEEVDHLEYKRVCVDDCGCFGDAMKGSVGRSLTPWESFYKDITLLFFVLVLLVSSKSIKLNESRDDIQIIPASLLAIALFSGGLFSWWFPLYFTLGAMAVYFLMKRLSFKGLGKEWNIAIALFLVSLAFTLYCNHYLPVKDFRPYAIGNNLIEQRTGVPPTIQFGYILKKKSDGAVDTLAAFPENWEANYEYVGVTETVLDPGKPAPAGDFNITDAASRMEITDSVLQMNHVFLATSSNLKKASEKHLQALWTFAQEAEKNGIHFYFLTSSLPEDIAALEAKGMKFNFCLSDEKVLKTVVRSNPGLVEVKKAIVINNWSCQNLPEFGDIAK